jgi:hypothetical protein
MWCVRYNNIGALDLEIEANAHTIDIFRKGYFITRNDDKHVFKIEALEINTNEEGNNHLIVGAVDFFSILNQRVKTKHLTLTSTLSKYIQTLLNNECTGDRGFGYPIEIKIDEDKELYRNATQSYVGNEIMKVCKQDDLQCDFYFDAETFVLEITKIKDRTIAQKENSKIIFSDGNDNLISSKYNVDLSEYKNVAYIHQKDNLTTGQFVGVGKGLERRETIIESQANEENPDLEYEANQTLSEMNVVSNFESEVDTTYYKYKEDYNVGDIVTIQNEFDIITNARIIEVVETWDNEGYSIEPIFEIYNDEIVDNVLLTEQSEGLLTENIEVLIIETSPIVNENKSDYIITENGLLIDSEV